MAAIAERLARKLPLFGAFLVQVMRDAASSWQTIDVNPRVGSGTNMSAAVGLDFAAANLADHWGEPSEASLQPFAGEHYVVRQYADYVTTPPPPYDRAVASMRFFYLDPGLRDDVGHHANYCRYITGEFRSRGVETLVFGYRELPPSLQAEIGATAHFQVHTYTNDDDDPFCPWLTGFDTLTQHTREDLSRLPAVESTDIVVATTVRPIQLAALIEWRRALPSDRRPTIVVEAVSTGLTARKTPDGLHISVPDPRLDPRPALFRYVARQLPREDGARFYFATFAPMPTEMFRALLSYPVRMLPMPYRPVAPLRNRAGARPVHVSILGHHRQAKGYARLPDMVRELLRTRGDSILFVQSVSPSESLETQQALRDIAAGNSRITLEEMPAGAARWPQLLEMSDLVLCPHRPEFYIVGFSSVLAEALANGIPAVVPGGTPLEMQLKECGGAGVCFDEFEPAALAAATGRALDSFDHFATIAHGAALRWPETQGPVRLAEELISLAKAS